MQTIILFMQILAVKDEFLMVVYLVKQNFKKYLQENTINLPPLTQLPEINIATPFFV